MKCAAVCPFSPTSLPSFRPPLPNNSSLLKIILSGFQHEEALAKRPASSILSEQVERAKAQTTYFRIRAENVCIPFPLPQDLSIAIH